MMSSRVPDLSIIIPSYNEESRLPDTLERIAAYLSDSGREAEVLVVDAASKDATAAVADYFCVKIPALRAISNCVNRGKGYSGRHAIHHARAPIALFTTPAPPPPPHEPAN